MIELCEPLDELVKRAAGSFRERLGREPALVAAAPGRVNLIGEHTDYNGGFALPLAINRWTVVAAAPGIEPGKGSSWFAAELDAGTSIDLTRSIVPHGHAGARFANYPLGVVRQFVDRGHRVPNFDAVFAGSIPIGAGLSSSASVEVATATLLESMLGLSLEPLAKARWCQHAEHEFVGTPCGIMDMLAIVTARTGHALLMDCRSLECRPVPLPQSNEAALLVVNTGVRRELASSAYADRRASCEAAARALGLSSLRDATPRSLEDPRLDERSRSSARHVVEENQRTLEAAGAMERCDMASLGRLMFASHDSLRDLYKVSCAELDAIVEAARAQTGPGGVLGARMTGAGFGGCAILLCRRHAVAAVADIVCRRFVERFHRTPALFEAEAVDGARAQRIP